MTQSALHAPGIDSAAVAGAELGHLQPEARGQGGNADIEGEPVAGMRALEGALGTINQDKDMEALNSGPRLCTWEMAQMWSLS